LTGAAGALAPARLARLGRYEVLGRLGEGAMGTVYKARDPLLDRLVAIKTVNLNLPQEELADYEARFYQEARAAGGLGHPNIVVVYDIGKTDELAYMAMEFLDGRELRAILTERSPLPLAEAVGICAQVADALAYAHTRGVVHRDIKPTNIMVLPSGLAKITDFGIARMRSSELKTMTGMILGSPRYMSPEQVSGKRVDHRSDVFSLGVVLYEMLAGQPPFQADTVHGVMYQTLNASPPPPSTLNAALPQVFDFIVAKALAKAPDDRYQRVGELADDLRAALGTASSGVGIREVPPLASTASRCPTGDAAAAARDDTEELPAKAATSLPGGFALAKAFDSTEATMRLAALSGLAADTERPAERKPARQMPPPKKAPPGPTARPAARDRGWTPWLWALASASALLALYLGFKA
jgi:serine/threonine-protein kinase